MNDSMMKSLYVPELGIILLYINLFLGYLYTASRDIVRKKEWKKNIKHGVFAIFQLINIAALFYVFNLRHGDAENMWNTFSLSGEVRIFAITELIFAIIFTAFFFKMLILEIKATKELNNDSIAEAILNLPSGFCFAADDGRIILANDLIKSLHFQVSGRPLSDANVAWKYVSERDERGSVNDNISYEAAGNEDIKSHKPAVDENVKNYYDGEYDENLLYKTADGSFYNFRRKNYVIDGEKYFQVDNQDVTQLVYMGEELQKVNEKINRQNLRTKELINDIFNKKSEQEILDMQRRVHHEVGQCIITADRYLSEEADSDRLNGLLNMWEQTFLWIPEREENKDMIDREKEICNAAAIGGCKVLFRGRRPRRQTHYLLYLAAAREAVTNSMQHAKATEVYVDGEYEDGYLKVVISDNGTSDVKEITEGVGLGKLREKLENIGIKMEMQVQDGFNMILYFAEKEESN